METFAPPRWEGVNSSNHKASDTMLCFDCVNLRRPTGLLFIFVSMIPGEMASQTCYAPSDERRFQLMESITLTSDSS
jgi:hypothetical protein